MFVKSDNDDVDGNSNVMSRPRFATLALVTLVMATRLSAVLSSSSVNNGINTNETKIPLQEEKEDIPNDMDLAEFKERYRRLIPFMTFYVASNIIAPQTTASPSSIQQHELFQQEQQYRKGEYSPSRAYLPGDNKNIPRKINNHNNQRFSASLKNSDKFIPSVQYDPKAIGTDNEYFTPVRYTTKQQYYQQQQQQLLLQQQQQANDYPTFVYQPFNEPIYEYYQPKLVVTQRPVLKSYETDYGDYVPVKTKPIINTQANPRDEYVVQYVNRLNGNVKGKFGAELSNADYIYPSEDFESIRYVTSKPSSSVPETGKLLDSSQVLPTTRRPVLPPISAIPVVPVAPARNPGIKLNNILKSFQLTNRLPERLNKDNIDSSIQTLVEILSILNGARVEQQMQSQLQDHAKQSLPYKPNSTRPKVITESTFQATPAPPTINSQSSNLSPIYPEYDNQNTGRIVEYYTPYVQDIDEGRKKNFKPIIESPGNIGKKPTGSTGSYDNILENVDYTGGIITAEDNKSDNGEDTRKHKGGGTNFRDNGDNDHHTDNKILSEGNGKLSIPPSLKYGATRGKPHVDYPAYATIPETDFTCKQQRYKGFFGDPATGCQVWHYCDLNGGKSSFLCPNGTIFSQVALTCDWWFNVKCESTTQLYVLNERLYKYILPIIPKFPEDFTGPEVDRYLELKFKEMEAKLKEKKLKKQQEEKAKEKAKSSNKTHSTNTEND